MAIAHGEFYEWRDGAYPAHYDLPEEDIRYLTDQLLSEREPGSDEKLICYRVENDSPYANLARTIECEVFEKYFGNDAEVMGREYGPYEKQSIFFLTIDQETREPAGVLRVIENGPAGLKTLNDLEDLATSNERLLGAPAILDQENIMAYHGMESLDECWDVGTVAVRKPYRTDTLASVQLYRALYVSALEDDIKHFVSIIDDKPYEKMTKYLGIPFVDMAGIQPFSYLGSNKSHAAYGYVPEFYPKMNRKRWTVRGALARKALTPLVKGTADHALQL